MTKKPWQRALESYFDRQGAKGSSDWYLVKMNQGGCGAIYRFTPSEARLDPEWVALAKENK